MILSLVIPAQAGIQFLALCLSSERAKLPLACGERVTFPVQGFRSPTASGLFFGIQTFNNLFLIIDKLVIPDIDVDIWRYTIALLAIILLLYGLIMRTEAD